MKTAELTGARLDYWVARAQGMTSDKFAPGAHACGEEVPDETP